MSQLIPFGKTTSLPSAFADIFAGVQTLERKHFETYPTLSFRGGKFHGTINGQTTTFMDEDGVPANKLDIIVVGIPESRARVLFPKYDASKPAPPICASINGRTPDKDIAAPQANNCQTCEKTIKVRGEDGKERAPCQQILNLAVVVQGHSDTVWKLKLPVTSIYHKESENSDYKAWDQLTDHLRKNGVVHPAQVVLRVTFSSDDQFPRLGFKPIGHLTEEMLLAISPVIKSEVVKEITHGSPEQVGNGQEHQQIAAPAETPKQVATPKQQAPEKAQDPEAEMRARIEAEVKARIEAEIKGKAETKVEAPAKESKAKKEKAAPVVVETDAELEAALDDW